MFHRHSINTQQTGKKTDKGAQGASKINSNLHANDFVNKLKFKSSVLYFTWRYISSMYLAKLLMKDYNFESYIYTRKG